MTFVKFFIGVLGAITIGVGAILVAVAVGLMTWVGTSDSVAIPEIHLTTSNGTVVAEDIAFLFEEARFVPDLGTASLRIRSTDGTPVFAGITDGLTADRFLMDGVDARSQSFWLTSDHGAVAELAWDIQPGDWSFVVTGDDEAIPAGVVIDGELGAAPFRLAAGTVGGIGFGAAMAGGLLLIVAFSLRRERVVPAASARVPASAAA